jgi:hypothetical protein
MVRVRLVCLALVLVVAGSAVAKSLPDYLIDPTKHPDYPPERFLTAVGVSDKDGPSAEEDARARVAGQVRSTLESELLDEQRETSVGGKVESYQRILRTMRTTTQFSHAEMIRVDPAAATKAKKLHYAFAYLARGELARVLAGEYETAAGRFRQSARAAGGHLAGGRLDDLPAYTTAVRQALGEFAAMAAKAFEIRAVTRREVASWAEDLAAFQRLEAERTGTLRSLKLRLAVEGSPTGATREVVLMALTGALAGIGVEATPGACGEQVHALRVRPEVECSRGSFGPQCKLSMAGAVVHCASGRVLTEVDLRDPAFKGMHSRDEARALEDLYRKVTADALRPLLAKALAPVLPIDEVQ